MIKILFNLFLISASAFLITAQNDSSSITKNTGKEDLDNINDIIVLDVNKNEIDLSDYNGKVLLIVNVASECGNTPQYAGLQEIYEKYNPQGFEILAFPCNDFGGQEPGSNEQIQNFCSVNYGVTFTLFDKIKVLGEDKSPLYERLINNHVTEKGDVKWNFEKFLISKEGKIVARFGNKVSPTSDEIISTIENELGR
jgi:glutathione peroxidase